MTLRPLTSHQSNEGILKRIFVSVGLCFEQIVWVAKQVIQRRDLRIKLLAIVLVALGWALRPAFATLFLNSKLCILRSGYEPNKDQGPKGSLISQPSLYNTLRVHWEVERSHSLCHELLLIDFPTGLSFPPMLMTTSTFVRCSLAACTAAVTFFRLWVEELDRAETEDHTTRWSNQLPSWRQVTGEMRSRVRRNWRTLAV